MNFQAKIFFTVFCYILCAFTSALIAQVSQLDSLESTLENILDDQEKYKAITDLAWAYSRSDPNRALKFAEQAKELAVKLNDEELQAHVNYYFGASHKNLGNFQTALSYFQVYFNYFDRIADKRKVCFVYYQTGVVKLLMGNYLGALDDFYNNLKLTKELGYKDSEANTMSVIATVYSKLNNFEKAIELNNEASQIFAEIGDKIGQGQCFANNANYYATLKNYRLADSLYQKSLVIFEETGDQYLLGNTYFNLGKLQLSMKNLDESENFMLLSLGIRQAIGHQKDLSENHIGLGHLYLSRNEAQKALSQFEQASLISRKLSSIELETEVAEGMAKTYEALNDFEKSIRFYKKANTLSDSLLNLDITQQISELNVKYETEIKENKIQLLQKDQIIAERNQVLFAAAAIIFLMVTLGIFILYINRKRNIKKLKEKNALISKMLGEKEYLLKEIHHRVKNNLQIISSLLSMQSRSLSDSKTIGAMKESQSRVKTMALIHEKLYQYDNLSRINMNEYMQQLSGFLSQTYQSEKDIKVVIESEEIDLDIAIAVPIGLIANELLSNALKYAFEDMEKGQINIKLLKDITGSYTLTISDSGKGLAADIDIEKSKSLGLKLVRTLTRQINGNLTISSNPGATFSIVFDENQLAA